MSSNVLCLNCGESTPNAKSGTMDERRANPTPLRLSNVSVSGIDHRDYPDFCDAFIDYAEDGTGRPLTDAELEAIPPDVIHEHALEWALER